MSPYQYRKSHCGDKTVVRSSYLHNGISYTVRCHLYIESGPWWPFLGYYLGVLSISQFTTVHLKIRYTQMKYMGNWSSNSYHMTFPAGVGWFNTDSHSLVTVCPIENSFFWVFPCFVVIVLSINIIFTWLIYPYPWAHLTDIGTII